TMPPPASSTLVPYTTLFRSRPAARMLASPTAWRSPLPAACAATDKHDAGARPSPPTYGLHVSTSQLPPRKRRNHEFLSTGKQTRSEEHTSELQSRENLVCRL